VSHTGLGLPGTRVKLEFRHAVLLCMAQRDVGSCFGDLGNAYGPVLNELWYVCSVTWEL